VELDFIVGVSAFDLELENEEETLREMGEAIRDDVQRGLASGRGSRGALPRPKDGGRALYRTGTLANSIGVVLRQKARQRTIGPMRNESAYAWSSIVRALGDRPPEENTARKVKSAARNTKRLRAEKIAELTEKHARGDVIESRWLRKVPTKKGQIFKVGKIRRRAAITNAGLAAVLSQPPRDLRSKNGGRKEYRVFEPNLARQRAALAAAKRVMRPRLVAKKGT
jgi:hypothetical protein